MIVLASITISVFLVGKLRHKALSNIFKIILLIIGVDSNTCKGSPDGSLVKNPPANAGAEGDTGLILGSGRSPGVGNGNSLQCPCLENPMDRGDYSQSQKSEVKHSSPSNYRYLKHTRDI